MKNIKKYTKVFIFSGLFFLQTTAVQADNLSNDPTIRANTKINTGTNRVSDLNKKTQNNTSSPIPDTQNTINNICNDDNSPTDEALNIADRLDDTVVQWATDKITSSFNYNWVDYKDVTDKAKQYFTSQGYGHYIKSLKDSGSTESIVNKKLILQVKPNGPGKIIKQGIYQGKYSWQVELPLNFTYYGVSETIPRKATVVVLVSRASKVDYTDGLAIEQLILKPGS